MSREKQDDSVKLPPERIMAYADGVLSSTDAAVLADSIERDPQLQVELQAYRKSRDALSGAYDDALSEPVPEHFRSLVLSTADPAAPEDTPSSVLRLDEARDKRNVRKPVIAWFPALAASCASLALGLIIGSGLSRFDSITDTLGLLSAGTVALDSSLGKTLDTAASAQDILMGDSRFTVLQTFQTSMGGLCREYEVSASTGAVVGIACRSESHWMVEAIVTTEASGSSSDDAYRPASGLDSVVLESILQELGALPGLGMEAETCLLTSNWMPGTCSNVLPEDK